MTQRFEELITELYKDLIPLDLKNFYIKPLYFHTNKNKEIEVKDINDLERALKVLFKEFTPSIDDISISFKVYNNLFEKDYYIHSPYTEDFSTLVETLFNNNVVKKELIVEGISENSEWNPVLQELEHYHNVKINRIEDKDIDSNTEYDFTNPYVCINYNYDDNTGTNFDETAYLSKSDLLTMSAILPCRNRNSILVLTGLSLDAINLLNRLFYVYDLYVVDPAKDMASHIASRANVIICNYINYRYINTWELNKNITIIDLTFGTIESEFYRKMQVTIPLKERHYDNIDIIYHTNTDNVNDIATKMLIKLWEETQPIKDNN